MNEKSRLKQMKDMAFEGRKQVLWGEKAEKSDFFLKKNGKTFVRLKTLRTFATANEEQRLQKQVGAIAQLVEQRTENPCVPGSIPGGTTQTIGM